jgi:DNA-binding NtrC family response regulator
VLVHTLVVTHQPALARRLGRLLAQPDVLFSHERQPANLWQTLKAEPCDLLVLDRDSLAEGIIGIVTTIRKLPERPEIVVLQGGDDPQQQAALTAAGCLAVVNRDLPDAMLGPIFAALVTRRREALGTGLSAAGQEPRHHHLGDFAATSVAMQNLLDLARRVVHSDSSLLILGETGVGKEWLGRAIHSEGRRTGAPFIAVNTSAVPDSLLESELFGHERGSFTGAERTRRGYFELAHRGTIFLDEIGDMTPHLQAKLLRVLQEKTLRRLGSEQSFEVDVRIMAATNRNLEQAMTDGSFRRDLYYRLGVVTLTVPPLRERRDDIADLAINYLERFRAQLGRPIVGIAADAMEALTAYAWPGNVRELINVMERTVLLCRGTEITLADLPRSLADALAGGAGALGGRLPGFLEPGDAWLERPLADVRAGALAWVERRYLEAQLERTAGRVGETAQRAGITARSLYSRMRALGLRKEDYRG